MSQADSFIEEVTEEVRRDRLYAIARKYGWIAGLVIVGIVGGAAFLEWQKAQTRAAAEGLGDSIYTALERESALSRVAALESIDAQGNASALVDLLASAELASADAERAGDILKGIIANAELPRIYRDLAALKLAGMADYPIPTSERAALLDPLTVPGAPLRLLAQEQLALLNLERGETDLARQLLQGVADDAETGPSQRQRVDQILTVMGPATGDS